MPDSPRVVTAADIERLLDVLTAQASAFGISVEAIQHLRQQRQLLAESAEREGR